MEALDLDLEVEDLLAEGADNKSVFQLRPNRSAKGDSSGRSRGDNRIA